MKDWYIEPGQFWGPTETKRWLVRIAVVIPHPHCLWHPGLHSQQRAKRAGWSLDAMMELYSTHILRPYINLLGVPAPGHLLQFSTS